jgi:predicted Ser/Thr protein kinase
LLHQGGPTKADLHLVPFGEGEAVVKDFAAKNALIRLWGRIQIHREVAAYERLRGVKGLPVFHGRLDAHALAIQYLEGKGLQGCRRRPQRRTYFRSLERTMESMHARGVIHNDLRGRDNVIVTHDTDRVYLLDLGGAVRLPPRSLRHRLLFRLLAQVDRAALLKWKGMLVPEEITAEEEDFLRRFRRWRRLWVFNPKGEGLLGRKGR